MTAALAPTFSTRAQVVRRTSASDSAGGQTDTYTEAEFEDCFFYGSAGGNSERQKPTDRVEINEAWTFIFRPGANIRHKDRIKVGTRLFEVGSISGPSSRNITLTIGAQEIT